MKICKKCIQPNTRPGIFFDDKGICGGCIWENEKNQIDWNQRKKELQEIALWAKKSSSNYDCAIGVSGGKDSTFQAIIARDELNLRCLLVNYEPEGITNIGKLNLENLKNLGFDVISVRPNPKIMKKLIRYDFFKHLNPVKATEFALYSSTYIISEKFNIPLIIQGENPGLTLGTKLTGVGNNQNALNADQLQTLSLGWNEYLEIDNITKNDLFLFHYDKKKLIEKGIRGIWLNYYVKDWSQRGNAEFSKKYGLKWRSDDFDPNSIGTYVPYAALDSDLHQVNQLLKNIKFGFGQCTDFACYDIREGRITRDEGIKLVKKYDGKCSDEYIQKFCNYIGISKDEFWKTANKFRGKMWEKSNNGEWINSLQSLLN